MSIDEAIAAARKMESRDLDAYVAMNVFGWKRGTLYGNGNGEWILPDGLIDYWNFTPAFSTEAEADLRVLVRVRETWNKHQLNDFRAALLQLFDERPGVLPDFIQYCVGDYSLAAAARVLRDGANK